MFACVFPLAILLSPYSGDGMKEGPVLAADITDVVERELRYDDAIPAYRVDVTTEDGVVTLAGSVSSVLAQERAARIAQSVRGVRAVVNRLEVEPLVDVEDSGVQNSVRSALLRDPATDSYEVQVAVNDGVVTLTGVVESWAEKRLCGTVAKGVRGVRKLENDVVVSFAAERADSEMRKEIDQSLQWNILVDGRNVHVEVEEGKATLSGIVGSAAEKQEARRLAWVVGVTSVDDSDLQVEPWAMDPGIRPHKFMNLSDERIQTALQDALEADPRVAGFRVTPTVTAGVVVLRGEVDNLKALRAAECDARNTVGVASVKNYLKVRPTGSDDAESITANVRESLREDVYLDPDAIDVSVRGGIVVLNGKVDTYFEKGQADDVASRVPGVVQVMNHLEVRDLPYTYSPYVDRWNIYGYGWYDSVPPRHTFKSDWEITRDIQEELWWSPFVDEEEVTVAVKDGVATLTGSVDSWKEWTAARENAYEAGATFVRNRLEVEREAVAEEPASSTSG